MGRQVCRPGGTPRQVPSRTGARDRDTRLASGHYDGTTFHGVRITLNSLPRGYIRTIAGANTLSSGSFSSSTFVDDFAAYGTKVYEITSY